MPEFAAKALALEQSREQLEADQARAPARVNLQNPDADKVKALEAENAALKKQVKVFEADLEEVKAREADARIKFENASTAKAALEAELEQVKAKKK
jgi:predicted  nucleic acid-binding Zn-ribbon protein